MSRRRPLSDSTTSQGKTLQAQHLTLDPLRVL